MEPIPVGVREGVATVGPQRARAGWTQNALATLHGLTLFQ